MSDVGTQSLSYWGLIVISVVFLAHLKWVNCSVSNFNRNYDITEGSPLRRFKGAKKEFRGLKVALIIIVVVSIAFCYHVKVWIIGTLFL